MTAIRVHKGRAVSSAKEGRFRTAGQDELVSILV